MADLPQTRQQTEYEQTSTRDGWIHLNLGQPSPSLMPVEAMQAASAAAFAEGTNPLSLQYGTPKGSASARASLAGFLSRQYGFQVRPDELMLTNGNSAALSLLCAAAPSLRAAAVDGKAEAAAGPMLALVENPTYFLAGGMLKEQGVQLLPVPTDAGGMDVDALERLLALDGVAPQILYTIPTFHNPTGTVMGPERRRRLVGLAERHGFLVLSDEPYNLLDFRPGGRPAPPPLVVGASGGSACSRSVVSMGSFSKILAPGLRLGWLHAHVDVLDKLIASSGVIKSGGCFNPVMGNIVRHLIDQGALERHVAFLRGEYTARLGALCASVRAHLPGAEMVQPDGGYFLWVRLPEGVDANALSDAAKHERVTFTPGTSCSAANAGVDIGDAATCGLVQRAGADAALERCAGHIRFSFAFYSEEELDEGVRRISRALAQLPSLRA